MYRSWVRRETPSADLFWWMAQIRMHFEAVCDRSASMRNIFMVVVGASYGNCILVGLIEEM